MSIIGAGYLPDFSAYVGGASKVLSKATSNVMGNLRNAYNDPRLFASDALKTMGRATLALSALPIKIANAQDSENAVIFSKGDFICNRMPRPTCNLPVTATIRQLNSNETYGTTIPESVNCNQFPINSFFVAQGDGGSADAVVWSREGREITAYVNNNYDGKRTCTVVLQDRTEDCPIRNRQMLCVKRESVALAHPGLVAVGVAVGGGLAAYGMIKLANYIKGDTSHNHQVLNQSDQVP